MPIVSIFFFTCWCDGDGGVGDDDDDDDDEEDDGDDDDDGPQDTTPCWHMRGIMQSCWTMRKP